MKDGDGIQRPTIPLVDAPDYAKATSRSRRSSAEFIRAKAEKNALQAVEVGTRLATLLVVTPSPGGEPSARFTGFADRVASRDRGH